MYEILTATPTWENIPIDVVVKIISYLPYNERIKAELVSSKFQFASQKSWLGFNNLVIDQNFNTEAKAFCLLKRCGKDVEEILSQANFDLPICFEHEYLLSELCPKLKSITFTNGSNFDLPRMEIDLAFKQLNNLKRLEYHETDNQLQIDNEDSRMSVIIDCLKNVKSLNELNLINYNDSNTVSLESSIGQLTQLRVLSLRIDQRTPKLFESICQLTELRELNLQFVGLSNFLPGSLQQISLALNNLECLVIVSRQWSVALNELKDFIGNLRNLKTFILSTKLFGPVPIVLLDFQQPQLLNIFVNIELYKFISTTTDNIRIQSILNTERGEAAKFLQSFDNWGFQFESHLVLKLIKRSLECRGNWDLYLPPNEELDRPMIEESPF